MAETKTHTDNATDETRSRHGTTHSAVGEKSTADVSTKLPKQRISRRTIGKAMIVIGVVGIIVSVVAVIVGQSLIRQVETSVDDSLVVTNEALAAVTDSITVTGTTVETIRS